ncbi:protein FAR1-RELATED SEQUENCE 6-like [Juglans microcarpa x Juglans regia]|uniref:protein FAR1-RELATED SEQUENCE 6-like n=1 Tax=Juglans microcarpa x Juglans regia TaxID=2249226 RepID=UPI001B7F193B|nr:protein FAR1-RELATED SEQUENCE 6-like [Juglans microcarpa x Juglans regia]
MGPPTPFITTSSVTSSRVRIEDPPNCFETEKPDTSSRLDEESKEDTLDSRDIEEGSAGTPECVQMEGSDTIEEPKLRMEFNSFEELLTYYKQYNKKCGFGVMTKRSEKAEDETIRYVTLACARSGKARNRTLNVAKPRPTRKTEFSETVKRVLDTNDLAGIRINKSFGSLVVGAGGFENLPFLENDCRNYMDKARHLRLGKGGTGALRDYFLRMQYKNFGFFALIDLDDEGRLENVFWADSRSRAAYQYFGDVVTFDTTYLTNRYGMPFAPFVGVNHHGKSILLEAGVISSEDTETFVWLF